MLTDGSVSNLLYQDLQELVDNRCWQNRASILICFICTFYSSICMVYTTHVENVGCFYVSKNDCISERLSMDILEQYEVLAVNFLY